MSRQNPLEIRSSSNCMISATSVPERCHRALFRHSTHLAANETIFGIAFFAFYTVGALFVGVFFTFLAAVFFFDGP